MKWINKIVDIPKLVRRLWIILWITLFIFVIAKLCFNLWYPIVIENENFIKFGNFIDNNAYLKYIIYALLYLLNGNILFLTYTKKMKHTHILSLIIINFSTIAFYFIKNFNNLIGCILEISFIIAAIIINVKNKTFTFVTKKNKVKTILNILIPPLVYLLLNLWQTNITFIRGIDKIISQLPVIINLALQIDYYIFLIITWIGVNYYMGISGFGWWWSKSTTELQAMKAEELTKKNPDAKLIADIDKELEKRKNEVKG